MSAISWIYFHKSRYIEFTLTISEYDFIWKEHVYKINLKWSPEGDGHSVYNSWEFEYRQWREKWKHTIKRDPCAHIEEFTD